MRDCQVWLSLVDREHFYIFGLSVVFNFGDTVVRLVEALCHKPEGRRFNS
jgi:hypothetical protein